MIRDFEYDKRKVAYFAASVLISGTVGYFFGDDLRLSEKPSDYIGLLFSFLAASVFAVVSIVGDPSMLLPGNRAVAWENAQKIQLDIQRLNFVFSIHLSILLLLVITELVEARHWSNFYWTFNLLAFLSTFGFLISARLPYELGKIQRTRLEQEIKSRRK